MDRGAKQSVVDSIAMRDVIVASLLDAKGLDVKVLDVRKLTNITDYMIVVTGTSDRHIKSIADRVLVFMREKQQLPFGMEGEESRNWVLIDFVDVVVHIMRDQARKHYDLEGLWDETFVDPAQSNPVDGTNCTAKPVRVNRGLLAR